MPPPPPPAQNPVSHSNANLAPASVSGSAVEGVTPNPLDVEFDQLWEGCSDLDPEDLERMKE